MRSGDYRGALNPKPLNPMSCLGFQGPCPAGPNTGALQPFIARAPSVGALCEHLGLAETSLR